jgi:hypothetical protein
MIARAEFGTSASRRAGADGAVRWHGLASPARAASGLVCVCAFLAGAAVSCRGDEIVTDRPDVTNSSIVVPTGSLQSENGIDLIGRDGGRLLDGPNSRLRLGIAPRLEVLVDLPSYVVPLRGRASTGFSDLAPAVKWQLGPLPGKIDLSLTVGAGLPTGTTRVTGTSTQPYIQLPWSREIGDGWGVSGMLTAFLLSGRPTSTVTTEPTFAIDKEIGPRSDFFLEYVGDYPSEGSPSHLLDSGGAFRITPSQQIDFHIGAGLNRAAPSYIIGIGYSIRFDGLF